MQNPRPRKYASDAERQAAYRNRASMVEFRADEKTAEKLTEIATTLDISRSDLLLSMVKFALTNHQWARFGLTHKTLPRYEENPIMATKKFSPAQIAAQKLFAERARAGTLGQTVKRKANPVTKMKIEGSQTLDSPEGVIVTEAGALRFAKQNMPNDLKKSGFVASVFPGARGWVINYGKAVKRNPITETLIYGLAPGETRDYMEELMYAGGQKLTQAQIDKVFKAASDAGYHSFRVAGFDPTMKPDFAAAVKPLRRKRNPDKTKPRAYVKRASQATGAPPSKRLVTRRKKALTAPAGYFPNPDTMGKSKKKANFPFCVETKATENWSTKACFKTMQPAKEYAVALSKQYPNLAIRVMHYAGGAM